MEVNDNGITVHEVHYWALFCSLCSEEFEGLWSLPYDDNLVDQAIFAGWHVNQNEIYCPACSEIEDERANEEIFEEDTL
jgi:hypothetical protein